MLGKPLIGNHSFQAFKLVCQSLILAKSIHTTGTPADRLEPNAAPAVSLGATGSL